MIKIVSITSCLCKGLASYDTLSTMEGIDDFVMKLSPFLANFGYYNTDACSVVLYMIKSIANNVHTCIVLLCCPNSKSLKCPFSFASQFACSNKVK